MGRRGKGVLGRLPSSVCALSPSHMMQYVPLAFSAPEVWVAVVTVGEWML